MSFPRQDGRAAAFALGNAEVAADKRKGLREGNCCSQSSRNECLAKHASELVLPHQRIKLVDASGEDSFLASMKSLFGMILICAATSVCAAQDQELLDQQRILPSVTREPEIYNVGSIRNFSIKQPSGKGLIRLQLAIEQDEAEAKRIYELMTEGVSASSTGRGNLGDEAKVWKSWQSGGTIIFRSGVIVASVNSSLVWDELYEIIVKLEKEMSAIPVEKLREQLGIPEAGASLSYEVDGSQFEPFSNAIERAKAFQKFKDQLLTAKNDDERQKAILALGNLGDHSAVTTLMAFVDSKHSTEVRNQAISALALLGAKEAVPVFVEILQKPAVEFIKDEEGNDAIIRRSAATALGKIGDKAALPVLVDVHNRKNEYKSVKELAGVSIQKIEK